MDENSGQQKDPLDHKLWEVRLQRPPKRTEGSQLPWFLAFVTQSTGFQGFWTQAARVPGLFLQGSKKILLLYRNFLGFWLSADLGLISFVFEDCPQASSPKPTTKYTKHRDLTSTQPEEPYFRAPLWVALSLTVTFLWSSTLNLLRTGRPSCELPRFETALYGICVF